MRKPAEISGEVPRDVIARFHNFQDKEKIRIYMKTSQPVKYGKSILQIFPDLAVETLARRRTLKPLLEQMKTHNIQYSWGFPACLTGRKEGRTATLRFPEDTPKFCKHFELPIIEIPGWWEKRATGGNAEELQMWQPVNQSR